MSYTAMWFNTHRKSNTKQIIASHFKDGWVGSGNFADIHEVGGYLVLTSPLNHKPFLVVKDYDDLKTEIKLRYGFNILDEKPKDAF